MGVWDMERVCISLADGSGLTPGTPDRIVFWSKCDGDGDGDGDGRGAKAAAAPVPHELLGPEDK